MANLVTLAGWLLSLGLLPTDDPQVKLRKATLNLANLIGFLAWAGWGIAFWALVNPALGLFNLSCALIYLINLFAFGAHKREGIALFVESFVILLGPLITHLAWGGFFGSGGAVLLSFLAPALVTMVAPRRATGWFVAFLAILAVAGWTHERFPPWFHPLPPEGARWMAIAIILSVTTTLYFLLQHALRSRDHIHEALVREQDTAERLLLNVLPKEIAERLKQQPAVIADGYPEVSVLFADIAGFTTLSERLPADELVAMLDEIFSAFDRLTERHGLEKIKTIGDAYMVAGGLPQPKADHARAIAELALDMRDALDALPCARVHGLTMRIGIHTGPVVAGVIGQRKFSYDMWGDTVNVASRMESHGAPGAIQLSDATYRQLGGAYELEPRGAITVKGKGEMQTYWLKGRLSPSAVQR